MKNKIYTTAPHEESPSTIGASSMAPAEHLGRRTSVAGEGLGGDGGVVAGRRLQPLAEVAGFEDHGLAVGACQRVLDAHQGGLCQSGDHLAHCSTEEQHLLRGFSLPLGSTTIGNYIPPCNPLSGSTLIGIYVALCNPLFLGEYLLYMSLYNPGHLCVSVQPLLGYLFLYPDEIIVYLPICLPSITDMH